MRRSTVADVMTTDVRWVPPDATFAEVVDVLAGAAVRALPVLDADRRLLGVVSEADLLVTLERAGTDPPRRWWRPRHVRRGPSAAKAGATNAAALMSAPVWTVAPGDPVAAAARGMREHGVSWLPVVDDGRVVGVLGRADLLTVFHRDDAAIRAEVTDEVFGGMLLVDPARITVRVAQGVVTVTGELDTRADTEVAVRLVEGIEGVVSVVDLLHYRVDERLADATVLPRF
ncbi:CBS domain-containing protein [Pseudonocardia hydrocarbonoxydans]|uniref:CBS domain-containing protein n=1 Tax=Pseudonocardia hydrocarbonoxydans TaxID=76726 RepID=UPI0031E38656